MQPSSASELAIANAALVHCKEAALGSFADKRPAARRVVEIFGNLRDRLQRETDWNFGRVTLLPAADPVPPAVRWAFRFAIDPGILAVRSVDGLDLDGWELVGEEADAGPVVSWLLCDVASPVVIATRRVADPARWDATFRQVFELALAAGVGPALGMSATEADALLSRSEALLSRAKRLDAREKARAAVDQGTSWILARRRGIA